jgi:tryptophan-rich sensory protein
LQRVLRPCRKDSSWLPVSRFLPAPRGFAAARGPLTLFIVQLGVDALWSWLYFRWHLGAVSFVEVALLRVLIAAALNFATWRLNPGLL